MACSNQQPCAMLLQIKQQLQDLHEDYDRLKATPAASQLKLSFDDILWASDMVTSRSFTIDRQLGESPVPVVTQDILTRPLTPYLEAQSC